ncbi:MAG: sigma-54 dependent transcriptional regulator [Acidobacteriota bacterium]
MQVAQSARDRNLLAALNLSWAECQGLKANLDCSRAWIEGAKATPNPSLEILAESSRVAGQITARGDPGAAHQHFARAARALHTVGNVTARREVLANAAAAGLIVGVDPAPPPGEEFPHRRGFEPWTGPDAPPATSTTNAAARTARALEAAAALADFAGYPPLAGAEALALLHAAAAAPSAVVAEHAERHAARPVAWFGCDAVEAAAVALDEARVHTPLGTWRDCRYELVFTPPVEPAARITAFAVERLVKTAVDLHAARERERDQAALWPEATPEQQLGMIFASEAMTDLVKTARRIAPSTVPILITGETGTGKELLARAIHEASPRREKGLVPFNCSTVPKEMLDSHLFGHRRGAFTGAVDASPGVIRAAAGGTLFLDEIGELGLDVQPKLLRFLESGEIHPLGEPRPVHVDVRIIAATNARLDQLVDEGRFRDDLYYRLHVVRLHVPPLRERREEIPLLINHYLDLAAQETGKTGLRLAEETMEFLVLYHWPGNIRQLANEIRRISALAEPGAVLMPEHLSPAIAASRRTRPASEREPRPTEITVRLDQPMSAAIEHVERAQIQYAMADAGTRVEDAARALGLSRKGLYLKRQRLGIK